MILLVLDPHLALLTFAVLPLLIAGGVAFRIASAGAYRETRERIAEITGYLQETPVRHSRGPRVRPGAAPRQASSAT